VKGRGALRAAWFWCALTVGALLVAARSETRAQNVLGDVVLKRAAPETAQQMPPAVFPHWAHRIRFTCNVCHPGLYPMKGGETAVTMDEISEQKSCGVCHNGRVAWGVSLETCARCHSGL